MGRMVLVGLAKPRPGMELARGGGQQEEEDRRWQEEEGWRWQDQDWSWWGQEDCRWEKEGDAGLDKRPANNKKRPAGSGTVSKPRRLLYQQRCQETQPQTAAWAVGPLGPPAPTTARCQTMAATLFLTKGEEKKTKREPVNLQPRKGLEEAPAPLKLVEAAVGNLTLGERVKEETKKEALPKGTIQDLEVKSLVSRSDATAATHLGVLLLSQ